MAKLFISYICVSNCKNMFFFGFLSSTVPYIIIACLYAIGFGLYSGSKLKGHLHESGQSDAIQLSIEDNNNEILSAKTDCFFVKFVSKYKFTTITYSGIYKAFLKPIISYTIKIPDCTFLSECYSFNLFSRPPPSL